MQQDRGDCQTGSADWDDTELHVPARQLGRQERAATDPQGRCQEKIAAVGLGEPHFLHAVGDQVELGIAPHEHEIGLADHRQHQVPIMADGHDGAQDLAWKISDRALLISTAGGFHSCCRPQAGQGHTQAEQRGHPVTSSHGLGQGRCHDRT